MYAYIYVHVYISTYEDKHANLIQAKEIAARSGLEGIEVFFSTFVHLRRSLQANANSSHI